MAFTEQEPLVVRKKSHRFYLWVNPNGSVEYRIDNEEKKYTAKAVADNMVAFKETHEMYIGDTVEFIDGIKLDELDFSQLKLEQNIAVKTHREKKDEMRELTLEGKSKKELLHMVDKWSKSIKSIKRGKVREKYAIHTFVIGRENFRMIERIRDGEQIINPDYKILTEYKKAGGIAVDMGEVIVWKYYFEEEEVSEEEPTAKKGKWKTARMLTFNEQICYEIIKRYGVFSDKTE